MVLPLHFAGFCFILPLQIMLISWPIGRPPAERRGVQGGDPPAKAKRLLLKYFKKSNYYWEFSRSQSANEGVHFLGAIFGSNFWGAIFGSNFREQFSGAIFGSNFSGAISGAISVAIFGSNFHEQFWGAIFGSNFREQFWEQFSWAIFGSNFQEQFSGAKIGPIKIAPENCSRKLLP